MANPEVAPKPGAAPKKSLAGRYLFLMILGFVVGIVATVMLLRAWQARQDPFPDALMHVQGWHMGQLDAAQKANQCTAASTLPHLQALRMMTTNLEDAFPGLRDDERFRSAASSMRAAADRAIANPPQDCAALATTLKALSDGCRGCHRDFRD